MVSHSHTCPAFREPCLTMACLADVQRAVPPHVCRTLRAGGGDCGRGASHPIAKTCGKIAEKMQEVCGKIAVL